jgi:hypothetical protein
MIRLAICAAEAPATRVGAPDGKPSLDRPKKTALRGKERRKL